MIKAAFTILLAIAAFSLNGQNVVIEQLINKVNALTIHDSEWSKDFQNEFRKLSDEGKANDAMLHQLFMEMNLPEVEVTKFIDSQQPDGSWKDINYKDNKRSGWDPTNHCMRIHTMTRVYKSPASKLYNSTALSAAIHKAMEFWFKAGLRCPNWWYNEIGIPKALAPSMIILKNELSDSEKTQCVKVLENSKFKMTGQNKVWLASNIFMKALLTEDERLARQARDTIFSEIFISAKEGLQPDYSFHQHGPQMQFGNYGLAYISTMSRWLQVFKGTPLELEPAKEKILINYITQGIQWTVWRGYMDVNACARQVFPNSQRGKAHALMMSVMHVYTANPTNRELKACLTRNWIRPEQDNDLIGFQYFWRSDFGVMRTPHWYASVRMHSDRTIGFEMTNNENLQSIFTADGALLTMCDGTEYIDIFPVWDWKKLPGVTVADNGKPIPYRHPNKPVNNSDFVGGLSCNVSTGMTAMVLDYENRKEHKAYFFLEEGVVALGAGITVDSSFRTTTGLGQNFLKGDVKYGYKNEVKTLNKASELKLENPSWIHHNQVGYIPLSAASISISNKTQTGTWRSIMQNGSTDIVSREIFSAYIDHGVQPKEKKYAYFVAPATVANDMPKLAARLPFTVVSNNDSIQAITTSDHQGNMVIMAAFYSEGSLKLSNGAILTSSTPGLIAVNFKDKDNYTFYFADPTQKLSSMNATLEMPWGKIGFSEGLPNGDKRGKSAMFGEISLH